MTDDELQNKADEIHALFHNMPNGEDRDIHYRRWLSLYREQSKRIFWSYTNVVWDIYYYNVNGDTKRIIFY